MGSAGRAVAAQSCQKNLSNPCLLKIRSNLDSHINLLEEILLTYHQVCQVLHNKDVGHTEDC